MLATVYRTRAAQKANVMMPAEFGIKGKVVLVNGAGRLKSVKRTRSRRTIGTS